MTQGIITGIILIIACFLAVKMILKSFKEANKHDCNSCSSDCASCGIDPELKKKIIDAVEAKKGK
ncbi:MAG: hypothetical protein WCK02_12455 [Bacteroidota bacterium]